jgi:hypothetical protein
MVRCVFSPSLLKVKEEKQQHNTKNLCGMMSGNTEFRPTFFRSVAPIKVGRNRLIFFLEPPLNKLFALSSFFPHSQDLFGLKKKRPKITMFFFA